MEEQALLAETASEVAATQPANEEIISMLMALMLPVISRMNMTQF
jgi:hypothetical protein